MNIYMKGPPNLCRPFRAFPNLHLNPGLAPWAFLLDPFGVRSFVTETSYVGWSWKLFGIEAGGEDLTLQRRQSGSRLRVQSARNWVLPKALRFFRATVERRRRRSWGSRSVRSPRHGPA